jgi:hypothetical protein
MLVTGQGWRRGALDSLLSEAADDVIADVLIADLRMSRIYHLDGGADCSPRLCSKGWLQGGAQGVADEPSGGSVAAAALRCEEALADVSLHANCKAIYSYGLQAPCDSMQSQFCGLRTAPVRGGRA